MNPSGPGSLVAAASYSTVGAVLTLAVQRGCVIARTGVGVATLTLDKELDANDCIVIVTARGAAGNSNVQVAHTSDAVKTISAFVAAVATEMAVDVAVYQVANGTLN